MAVKKNAVADKGTRKVAPKGKAPNNKKKKKLPCCCGCLLTTFIIVVVILGAGVGVGWYFGDQYTRQNFDMGLGECFGVVFDLFKADKNKIVTNSYEGTPASDFESSLKKQLFLKADAPLNKDELINIVMPPEEDSTDGQRTDISNSLKKEAGKGGVDADETETGGIDADDPLTAYISSLYSNINNLDIDSLAEFDAENLNDYLLTFSDKQLAAFVGDIFNLLSSSGALNEASDELGVSMADLIKVPQIIFHGNAEDPRFKVTVSADFRLLIKSVLEEQLGFDLSFFINLILPEKLYVTADLGLKQGDLKVYINEMDDAKMERLFKLLGGIGKSTGMELDLNAMIDEYAGEILGTVSSVFEYGEYSSIGSGVIRLDILQYVFDSFMNGEKPEEERLVTADIFYVLKYLLTSSFDDAVVDEYTWKDWYVKNGTVEVTYKPADVSDYTLIDYKQEFLKELSNKYLIDLKEGTDDEIKFDDLMAMFGIGGENEGEPLNFADLINPEKLKELAGAEDLADIKVKINDRMLGAIFNSQVDSLMGENEALANAQIEVYQVHIFKDLGKIYMKAGLALNAKGILPEGDAITEMLGGLLGDKIMLSVTVEITLTDDEGYEYAPTRIGFNDLTSTEIDRLMAILAKFGMDLGGEGLLGSIDEPLRNVIKTMSDFMPGLTFETSSIMMADLFTVMLDKAINTDSENPLTYRDIYGELQEFAAKDLQDVVKGIYGDVDENGFNEPGTNHQEFLADVVEKYSFDEAQVRVGNGEDEISTFNDLTEIFKLGDLDNSLINVSALMRNPLSNEELRPYLSDAELANLIMDMMYPENGEGEEGGDDEEGSGLFDGMEMVSFKIVENDIEGYSIEIIIKADINDLIKDGGDILSLISVEKLYITISVNLVEDEDDLIDVSLLKDGSKLAYPSAITLNSMDKAQMLKMNALLEKFAGEGSLDLEARALDIGNMIYDQLNSFKSQMGDVLTFAPGGVYIASVFDLFAAAQTSGSGELNGEEIKAVMQGLFEKTGDGDSDNNYILNELITNPIETELAFDQSKFISDLALSNLIADNVFGGVVSRGVSVEVPTKGNVSLPKFDLLGGITLEELNIYPSSGERNPFAKFENDEADLFEREPDVDYIELIYKVPVSLAGAENVNNSLTPDKVYVSLYMAYDGTGYSFVTVGGSEDPYLRINKLTYPQVTILLEIIEMETSAILESGEECLRAFNDNQLLKTASYDEIVGEVSRGGIILNLSSLGADPFRATEPYIYPAL